MEEATSNLLSEALKIYGLPGVILILVFMVIIVTIYKLGPEILDQWERNNKKRHDSSMSKSIKRGPKVQQVLREYFSNINTDHIFVAEFHNGSTDVVGIPYMKFDVIYEHISPNYHGNDIYLSRLYENEHILTHDQLPGLLFSNYSLKYHLEELEDIDEHLYLRMKGREVKSIALSLICDKDYRPVAFVGGINFSDKEISLSELNKCASAIEKIYRE